MDKTLDQRNKCWLEIERQDKLLAECRETLRDAAVALATSDKFESTYWKIQKLLSKIQRGD